MDTNSISEVTRRNVFDAIALSQAAWCGRMSEVEFLGRLYGLSKMPSYDYRHEDAAGDIARQRIMNLDLGDDWVFSDSRFDLMHCPDDELLRFLAEVLHPVGALGEEPFQNHRVGSWLPVNPLESVVPDSGGDSLVRKSDPV